MADETMTFADAMAFLKVSRSTMNRLRDEGKLTAIRNDPTNKRTRIVFDTREVRALRPMAPPTPKAEATAEVIPLPTKAKRVPEPEPEYTYDPPWGRALVACYRLAEWHCELDRCSDAEINQAIATISEAQPRAGILYVLHQELALRRMNPPPGPMTPPARRRH
jgi:hypothetical protein